MKRNITVASLAAIIALVVIVVATSTNSAVSQENNSKVKMSDVGYIVFEKAALRSSGEKEFYIVLKKEDKAMAIAIAKALNETIVPFARNSMMGGRITQAKAISGNLVHVPLPSILFSRAAMVEDKVISVTFNKPAKRIPEAPINTEALIMLSKLEDLDVRLSALIALSRQDTIGAYKALQNAYATKSGWTKRCASLGLALYETENEKTLKQMRKEFRDAYQNMLGLLERQPRTLNELNRQIKAMKGEIDKMVAVAPPVPPSLDAAPKTMQTDLNAMVNVIAMIQKYYEGEGKDELTDKTLMDAAMKGVSEHLDKYSSVFDLETKKKWDSHMNSAFVGIGVTLERNEGGDFIIASPIFGSPAYKAGIQARDVIVTVDGKEVQGIEMDELRKCVTGKPGTVVNIGIMRKGWKSPKNFPIVRAKITMPVVLYKMMPGNVGYLRLLQFANGADAKFAKALQSLMSQNLKGLVLDLRNNPGGGLNETLRIANMFLSKDQKIA